MGHRLANWPPRVASPEIVPSDMAGSQVLSTEVVTVEVPPIESVVADYHYWGYSY